MQRPLCLHKHNAKWNYQHLSNSRPPSRAASLTARLPVPPAPPRSRADGADSTTQASWLDEGPPRPRPEPRTRLARALGPRSERQVHGRNAEAGEPSSGSWRRRASDPATRWWRPPRRPCGATLPAALPVPASGHSEPSSTFAVARGSLSRMLPRHRSRQKSEAMVLTETLSNVRAGGPFCARDGGVREARSCPGETPPGPDAAPVRRRPGETPPR